MNLPPRHRVWSIHSSYVVNLGDADEGRHVTKYCSRRLDVAVAQSV